MNELEILFDVTRRLSECSINYMLTGSMAMNYYALPRMTRDIDIIIEIKRDDIIKLFDAFKDDYYISPEAIEDAIKYGSSFNAIHNQVIIKIYFIIRKNSEYRITEFNRRKKVIILGQEIFIVTIEDLVLSKLLWAEGRESILQRKDIENLMLQDYDKEYFDYWKSRLALNNADIGINDERYK